MRYLTIALLVMLVAACGRNHTDDSLQQPWPGGQKPVEAPK